MDERSEDDSGDGTSSAEGGCRCEAEEGCRQSLEYMSKWKLRVAIAFLAVDAARIFLFDFALVPATNLLSVLVTADASSLLLALTVSLGVEGWKACRSIFHLPSLCRFLGISVMFTAAMLLHTLAYLSGLSPAVNSLIGNIYLPMSAMVALALSMRTYGVLEWLSLSMLMLGIGAFVLLRDRCHFSRCHQLRFEPIETNPFGMVAVLLSVTLSCWASTWAERIYKHRSSAATGRPLLPSAEPAPAEGGERFEFYIYRAQLDIWSTLVLAVAWMMLLRLSQEESNMAGGSDSFIDTLGRYWFGRWTKRSFALVLVLVAQKWLAQWMVQYYSTVSKAVVSSISIVLVVMVGDSTQGKYRFMTRLVPSSLITVVILLASLIFQTGRMGERSKPAQRQTARECWSSLCNLGAQLRGILGKYSVAIAYILADAFRQNLLYVTQANRYFVPQTMVVMSSVLGCAYTILLVYRKEGSQKLRDLRKVRQLIQFVMCGAIAALTQTLLSVAFALGTSSSLAVALGKVYTPLVSILGPLVVGWRGGSFLQWLCLIVLTAASSCFGLLDSMGSEASSRSPAIGMLCVVGSATSSCMQALLFERFSKEEDREVGGKGQMYEIKKARLDAGSIIFSTLMLPVMGFLGTLPGNPRTDLAYWTERPGPDYWGCYRLAVHRPSNAGRGCDQATGVFTANATLVGESAALAARAAKCVCGSGVLLGWGTNYMNYVTLIVVIAHSYLTGAVINELGSEFRSVLDGFPILLIYFILDPVFSRVPLAPFQNAYTRRLPWPPPDSARDAMCFILPLSCTAWWVASPKRAADSEEDSEENAEEDDDEDLADEDE